MLSVVEHEKSFLTLRPDLKPCLEEAKMIQTVPRNNMQLFSTFSVPY